MGSRNHALFIDRHKDLFQGPFLEIGSKDYGTTLDMRSLFPGQPYVGVDMEAGKGVDQVLDLTRPFDEVDAALGQQRFGTIFCLCVMEHCAQPFIMAQNMTRLLKPGGRVYVSVPFAWKFHGYPSDYWRFTHEGVKVLFPRLQFDPQVCCACTEIRGDFRPLDKELCRMRIRGGWHRRQGHFLRGVTADVVALLGALGPLRWLTRYRYLHPPTYVEMVGTLPPA